MKQLEGDVDEKCQFIDSLSESDVLNRVEIKCNISSSLTDIANIVPVFGKVYIESASKSVMLTKKKQQQAQLVLPRALSVSVETIQVELQQTIENKSHVRGCCILPDGRFVLTYPDLNKVEIVKEDGSADFSLNVTAAYGVAHNDADNTLAITSWWFNGVGDQITITDLTQRKVKKTFSLRGQTTGIATTNKTLLYYKTNKAIQAIDLSNESTREIVPKNKESFVDVAICNEKMYYSSYEYDTVICCDLKGTPIWTFKNKSVLSYPSGISADKDGNVFVVGHGTQNVVVISSDGRTHKELLTLSENFRSPWSINFGREINQLLVATYHNKSYLFTVFQEIKLKKTTMRRVCVVMGS
ncbi:uncharacterized protein [Mytilus edulis]|uniref:uncharacterized protein n=1 Tax=Mytilus edulis TaxID=6550 RepID=UPI0039F11B33